MKAARPIFINDTHLRQQVEREQSKRGDATLAKTAARLISERLAQLELIEREDRLRDQQRPTATAAA
jgi:hypothetical protein